MARISGVTPEETKEKLIEAAATVFADKGYERATVAEIAREAGATNGAIYTHYDHKADLLVDAMRVHLDEPLDTIAPGDRDGGLSLLISIATRLIDRDDRGSTLLLEGVIGARRDPDLQQILATAIGQREQMMTALLAESHTRGEFTGEVQAHAVARLAVMLNLGSLFVNSLGLTPVDPDDWEQVILQVISAFLQGEQ